MRRLTLWALSNTLDDRETANSFIDNEQLMTKVIELIRTDKLNIRVEGVEHIQRLVYNSDVAHYGKLLDDWKVLDLLMVLLQDRESRLIITTIQLVDEMLRYHKQNFVLFNGIDNSISVWCQNDATTVIENLQKHPHEQVQRDAYA